MIPHGTLLHAYRERMFGWGYGHIPLFAAVVAIGAGLHVAAYYLGEESEVSRNTTVLAVAIPVAVYLVTLYVLYAQLTRTVDPFHMLLLGRLGRRVSGPRSRCRPAASASCGACSSWRSRRGSP